MAFKANFSIDPKVWEAFKAKASSEGQTAAAVLNQLVRSYLEGPPNTNIRELVKREVQMQVNAEIKKIAAKIQGQGAVALSPEESRAWAEHKSTLLGNSASAEPLTEAQKDELYRWLHKEDETV